MSAAQRARPEAPTRRRLLVAASDEASVADGRDASLLRRLWPYLRPHATLLSIALLSMPVAAAASLLQPLLIKDALDATLVEHSASALGRVVWLFAGVLVFEFVARFVQTYLMQLAGQRTVVDLRRAVFAHIQRLRMSYFDRTPAGRVVTRVTNDVDSLSELFASGAVTAVADLLTLVGIVGFMLYLDWRLSLVALAALPPLVVFVNVLRRLAREAFRAIRVRLAQLNAYLAEQVQGIAVVQAFGREDDCAAEYREINAAYRDANLRSIRYDALLYSVVESVSVVCVALTLWYASVQAGAITHPAGAAAYVGTVVAFYEYIRMFFVPVRDLATKYTIIQSSLAASERIFMLLDTDEVEPAPRSESLALAHGEQAPARGQPASSARGGPSVTFEGVTFAYRPGHPVLHDVSFGIGQGQTVAVVGATGSGKTTLTALLLRLYEVAVGAIRLDGVDVRELDARALRGGVSVVPQDVFLFSGTVLDNLALGDPAPDRARVERALARVGALELVAARGGLDARVGERGADYSAGERQLLAFARALYRDAPLLILDEATANIDSETEARLQAAVTAVTEGRTSIVIAHRLSTIRHADRILVMHAGRLAEQGTHAELLALDGVYARLYRLQFGVAAGAA
ncbi:MAG: ABC transporter ATP-binding protein [Myxococcales bacterium]|nr:ABC transporter ATP-binding protein [Myxococcales bacterium]